MNFTVRYLPVDMSAPQMEFTISAGEYVTVNEIRTKIDDFLEPEEKDEDWIAPFLSIVEGQTNLDLISEERFIRTPNFDKQTLELLAYEREPLKLFECKENDDYSDFYICEIGMIQQRKTYMGLFSHIQNIGYTRLHLLRKEWTVKRIRLRVYELIRPLIKNTIGNK
jgi:hypothetical protein